MDNDTKEFYVEIGKDSECSTLNKSMVLSLLEIAENAFANKLYFCVRKKLI